MRSKTDFLAGVQCSRLLWWRVHEPEAAELKAGGGLHASFEQSAQVLRLAREAFPGGVQITDRARRVEATRAAIGAGAGTLFDAALVADDILVVADIVSRELDGWRLVDVKSSTSVKEHHILDVAVQTHVLERAGMHVAAVEIMHLNGEHRNPNVGDLFARVDVTRQVRVMLPSFLARIDEQSAVVRGALPVVAMGSQCKEPYACPFKTRCSAELPEFHVSTLYKGGRRVAELLAQGVERIEDITEPLTGIMERQRRAVQSGALVIEGDLAVALAQFVAPIAFLDFETVILPVPRWPGCAPRDQVPVQFSVHFDNGDAVQEHSWLAEGDGDPRRPLAVALLEACIGAATVVTWNASFERAVLMGLAAACPDLATPLLELRARVVDLLTVVRKHVYHPDFGGGFSLKVVLPALTGAGYDDLEVGDGGVASRKLERMMFQAMEDEERAELRRDLVAYCGRDTWALVVLLRRLRGLAARGLEG